MVIEYVFYLIALLCTIKTISEYGEMEHVIDYIEENTSPISSATSRRLAKNLRCFRIRVIKKTTELIRKARFVFNWRDPNGRYRDSITRMIQDAENYVCEDEIFFIIGQYRECLVKELIANDVFFSTDKMRLRLNDDLNNKNSVTFNTVKSIATLMAYSNAICFLAHQALHILSDLENAGAGNESVKRSLRGILMDKNCIYNNFSTLLHRVASYRVDTDVIQTVSKHTYDLTGLLELVENKAKWMLLKNADDSSSDKHKKEEAIMMTNNSNEPMVTAEKMMERPIDSMQGGSHVGDVATTMIDASEANHDTNKNDEEQVSKYITPKMIAQLILMSVEMGRLDFSNFADFVTDMAKWGVSFLPFFNSEAFSDIFIEYACDTVVAASNPHVGGEIIPLVNMTGFVKLNPEVYFAECILRTAITLEEDHNPNKVSFGISHNDVRRIY